jgi:TIR domain
MARPPTVFISYSWDNAAHRTWVRRLATRLVENGVKVWLDEWHVQPGESLTAFMESKLARSGHVLVICTPNYAKKSNARKGGVGYEQQIISARIASGIARRKFIPIIRKGTFTKGKDCAVPTHFLVIRAIDMTSTSRYNANFETLLRTIYKSPKLKPPPIGKPKAFKKVAASQHVRLSKDKVRLPNLETEGLSLGSGVARNEKHPQTFEIPPEDIRHSVRKGDVVKLMFEYDDSDLAGERMWVKVTGANGPYLVGTLNNQPIATND